MEGKLDQDRLLLSLCKMKRNNSMLETDRNNPAEREEMNNSGEK